MLLLLHVGFLLMVSSCFFLKLCGAQDIECTVTQDGGRTLYSVPEFTANGCHYSWLSITDHMLANQGERIDDQVVEKSNCTLLTSKCLELIRYSCSCISEGVNREATCTTNCSGNAGLQNGGEIQTAIPTAIPTEIPTEIVPTVATIVVLLLVLLVVLVVVLYCKCRDDIRSCCRRITNLFTSEKTEYEMADVEEQHG